MEPLLIDPQRQEGVSSSSCEEDHCKDNLHSNNEGFTCYFINNICQTSLVVAIITVITGIILVTKLWRNTFSTSAAQRQGAERKEQGLKICGVKLEENKTSMREENKVSILEINGDSSEEEEDISNILKLGSLKLSDKKYSDHFSDKNQSSNEIDTGNLVEDVSSPSQVDSRLSVYVSDEDPDHEPCVKETESFEYNSYRDVVFKNDLSLQTFTTCEVEATDEELRSVGDSRPTDNYVREEKESLEETGDCSPLILKDEDRQVIVSTQTETIIPPTTPRHLAPPKQATIITSSVPAIITPRESATNTPRESATISPRVAASITPSSPARITPRSRRHKLLPLREMNILSDPADIDRSCSESVDFRVDPVTFHQVHKGSAVKSNPNGRSKKNRN